MALSVRKQVVSPFVLVGSTRGNAGVSTLATGIAAELSSRFGKQQRGCLLVDACPKGGHLASNLSLRSHPNLVGLVSGVNTSTIKNKAQRKELWHSHAQATRRKNLWLVASPGEPLAAWWSTNTVTDQVNEYLWAVISDGVPVVVDIGELNLQNEIGWELMRNATLTVLIPGRPMSAISDLDLIYAVCASTARTIVAVPAGKKERDDTIDFWAQSLLGGWARYRERIIARENQPGDMRVSDLVYAQSQVLGVRKTNKAQQNLITADTVEEQLRVSPPEDVLWLPRSVGGAEQCERGTVPTGPLGKTIRAICDITHRAPETLVRKATKKRNLLALRNKKR